MTSGVATTNRSSARAYCRRHAFARSSSNAPLGTKVRGRSPRLSPMTYVPHRVALASVVGRFHDPATVEFLSVAGRVHRTAICRSDVSSDEPRELGELGRTM